MRKLVFVLIVIALIVTCPNRDRHITVIENNVTRIAESKTGPLGAILTPLFIKLFEYRIDVTSYLVFSIAEYEDRTLTIGVLGQVFFLGNTPEIDNKEINE